MATAALTARLACLLQALPDTSPAEVLAALIQQSLSPDPALGFE
jgi:hypothetical protein